MKTASNTICVQATDVSGQKILGAPAVPVNLSVGALVETFLGEMRLAPRDPEGRPVIYRARSQRQGRLLLNSELVGEALEDQDQIVLQPNIEAGGIGGMR